MDCLDFEDKIAHFDKNLVERCTNTVCLVEKTAGGEAELHCSLQTSGVLFKKLSENKCGYLCCKTTADYILFLKTRENKWKLHMFEIKKTIGETNWMKVKEQFKGAILNAMTLSGFLGIHLLEVICYTALQNDKLSDKLPYIYNPRALRTALRQKVNSPYNDWISDIITIDFGKLLQMKHQKIMVDPNTKCAKIIL